MATITGTGAWVYNWIEKRFQWVQNNRMYNRKDEVGKNPVYAPEAVKRCKNKKQG